jgi:hypothetical protein
MSIGSSDKKPEPRRVIEPNITKIGSFEELDKEGFVMFSLGPVYVFGGITDDLVAAYAAELKEGLNQDVYATTAQFDREVIKRCGPWNGLLSVMDKPNFQQFKAWMLGLQFVNRKEKEFQVVRHHLAPIVDPLKYDAGRGLIASALPVFCLSGMRSQMVPVCMLSDHKKAPVVVDFRYQKAEPDVVELGRVALEILKQS